jgi:hypothetical protein
VLLKTLGGSFEQYGISRRNPACNPQKSSVPQNVLRMSFRIGRAKRAAEKSAPVTRLAAVVLKI